MAARRSRLAALGALTVVAAVGLQLGLAHGSRPVPFLSKGLDGIVLPKHEPAPKPPPAAPPIGDRRVLSGVPDLMQTDPALELPGGGDSHCGPVAASNALVWLGAHGLPRLLPEGATERDRQIALVRALASGSYMGTSAHNGTGASGVLKGIDLYLRANGYRAARLEYQGWRAHQLRYSTSVRIPEVAFIADGLREGGVALISAGWYKPGMLPGVYRRHGGHWLTVVSAGVDSAGRDDPDALVLHDPAPWSGAPPKAHRVRAERLGEGWLIGEDGPFPSAGFRVLRGELGVKRPGEVAIIDGAVVLVPRRADALASAK
jgi:hypothetical protein